MLYKQIDIYNFGTIGHITLQLSDRGLVLVTGKNLDTAKSDSNGAGKSLLLEAFCWCLWGRTIREDKDDAVINERVGKNCKVCITFVGSNKTFKVIRYRNHEESVKPNDVELFLEDTNLSGSSMKATQAVINGIIGLTFETFCALMPGAGKNAAQMTDGDIKSLLEDMLQITALSKARLEADRRLKKVTYEVKQLENKLQQGYNQQIEVRNRLEEYQQAQTIYTTTVQEKVSALTTAKREAATTLVSTKLLLQSISESRTLLMGINIEGKQLQLNYKKSIRDRDSISTDFHSQRKKLQTEIDSTEGELKVRRGLLAEAMNLNDSCTTCSQLISESHAKEVQSSCEHTASILQERIASLTSVLAEITTQEVEALRAPNTEIISCEGALEDNKQRQYELQKAVQTVLVTESKVSGIEKTIEGLDRQIEEALGSVSPYEDWISTATSHLVELEDTSFAENIKLNNLQLQENQLLFWKGAFSASGIRSFILDNVTPMLNARAKHYCSLLTDDEMSVNFSTKTTLKSGDVREKFSIGISQKHGGSSYRSNSKGERQRANLVVCFALSDLAELHSNKCVDFRFLDEPFEGVDELGTDAVVALLQEQQARYPTVFVVTHQTHFKEVFPQELTVVKERGFSRLGEQ